MTYSSRDLEIVEGLEAIRRRPELYVGPADAEHSLCGRLLLCAVANIAGSTPAPPAVRLTLWSGDCFTLAFDGEPLSIALREMTVTGVTGVPHPELYHRFMYLMNPGADLLGVGAVAVNALSERLVVTTSHDGIRYRAAFRCGALVSLLHKTHDTDENLGVNCLTFKPDASVVPGVCTPDQAKALVERLSPETPAVAISAIDRTSEKPYWW